ncbi:aryl-sulfate sulfotransferase [Ferrimonas lipolytica]|uniref:Aryl-sulfate sulfotransferase n=1 Tax=Ferrimonas lipolytica TaxID=2724191 RepID=A0A6H1UG31_9GAMM|nr:aryl-sulfate sulfotransferase [Ferrimonas lipolytica]QIZ78041.1 aryl-sulfate sulfotransferase [Ferrimonas lipolytica]
MKKQIIASMVTLALLGCNSAMAAGFKPAPAAGKLGAMLVDPYGNSPLTALLDLGSKRPTDVSVVVHGKGRNGVDISYEVGPETVMHNDGVPIFGLYADYTNKVTVEYILDGKKIKEDYQVITSPIVNKYIDNRNVSRMQDVKVQKVAKGFEDRLYMVNSHTLTQQGSQMHWSGPKAKDAVLQATSPSTGALPFDAAPMTYVVDTQGEYRWWLNQDAVYDATVLDIKKRGYLMGLKDTGKGNISFVQGQRWGNFDLLGKVTAHDLPRGYVDLSHATEIMDNGHRLVRAAKANYVNKAGDTVHTLRDHILELDESGHLVDVWNIGTIMDPFRDALMKALDIGAVCVNVDMDHVGKTAELEVDGPYGDLPGVGQGRNWAHINSIDYDPKDDSIILSFRHQGVAKITRDKKVKWILAPSEGWRAGWKEKLLTPVDANNKPIKCTSKGVCEGDFDFSYTQHTAWLSSKGTLTVFDNGDGRGLEQPAMPTMKYSRFVEYKIDEEKGTVEQVWEYGKERGYDWYSPITSVVEYQADRNTMFGFGGSVHLFERGERNIGKINEIDYDTKEVKVEIDVLSDKPNTPHYRALLIDPSSMFGR